MSVANDIIQATNFREARKKRRVEAKSRMDFSNDLYKAREKRIIRMELAKQIREITTEIANNVYREAGKLLIFESTGSLSLPLRGVRLVLVNLVHLLIPRMTAGAEGLRATEITGLALNPPNQPMRTQTSRMKIP